MSITSTFSEIATIAAPPRTMGQFWQGWCEANELPAPVVRQPIPTVPWQADPDLQFPTHIPTGGKFRIGDPVTCDDYAGLFRRCKCGSTEFHVAPGAGPHLAQLHCDHCTKRNGQKRGGRWLSPAMVEVEE